MAPNPLIEEGLRLQRENARAKQQQAQQAAAAMDIQPNEPNPVGLPAYSSSRYSHFFPGAAEGSESAGPPAGNMVGRLPSALAYRETGMHPHGCYRYRMHCLLRNWHVLHPKDMVILQPPGLLADGLVHRAKQAVDLCCHASFGTAIMTSCHVAFYRSPASIPDVVTFGRTAAGAAAGTVSGCMGVTSYQTMHTAVLNNLSMSLGSTPLDCPVQVISYSPHAERFHLESFPCRYTEVVDFTSTIAWNKAANRLYVTSCNGIKELRLEEGGELSYRFHVRRGADACSRISSDKTHITTLTNDDFAAREDNHTMFAGTRNGQIHQIDFRQPPGIGRDSASACSSVAQRQMRYCIQKIATLPHLGYALAAADICNEIALFDIRRMSAAVGTVQKGTEGGLSRAGFWVSPDNKLLIAQHNDLKGAKEPIKLAYFSTTAAYSRIGDPVPLLLDGHVQYGSVQLAKDCSVHDAGRNPYATQDVVYGWEDSRSALPVCEQLWGMYSASNNANQSPLQIFTLGGGGSAVGDC